MQTPSGRKLVELFGAPGAGKTTLAAAAISKHGKALTRYDLAKSWRRQPLRRRLHFVAKAYGRPGALRRMVELAWRGRLRKSGSLALLARLPVKAEWVRSQPGIVLLDQGLLQDLWSIFYANDNVRPDPATISQFVGGLYEASEALIVFIDVEPEVASSRIGGRDYGHSRLDGLPRPQLEASLARSATLPKCLAAAASAAGLNVELIDGQQSVDLLASELAARLVCQDPV